MGPEDVQAHYERLLAETPLAVGPFYMHRRNSEPIVLYRGDLEVVAPARSVGRRVRGTVVLRWLPTPRVEAHFIIPRPAKRDLKRWPIDVSTVRPVTDRPPSQVDRRYLRPTTRSAPPVIHGTCDLDSPEIGDGSALAALRLHVVNFPLVNGRPVAYGGRLARSRLTLAWAGWRIDLDEIPTAADAEEDLKRSGGYRFTHVGVLTRDDEGLFVAAEAMVFVDALAYFLMFASGANCGPVLPVGFAASGDPCWAYWRTPGADSWRVRFMWLDEVFGAAQLEAAFPLFMERWADPATQKLLRKALHYYEASNTPPSVDASLVLAFVGLEVLERLALPGIRGDADSRVRKLANMHGIPLGVPKRFAALGRSRTRTIGMTPRRHWRRCVIELRIPIPTTRIFRSKHALRRGCWSPGISNS